MGTAIQKRPIDNLKATLNLPSVQEQFRNALKGNAPLFIASIISLFSNESSLKKCDPSKVIAEALKAAVLKLPIENSLGYAYIVPYGDVPTFTIGWKGYVQLAQRTGRYRRLNAGFIYDGMEVKEDILTGDLRITGEATSDNIKGFFAYFELINGFSKAEYWSKKKAIAHGKRYSPSYSYPKSTWQTNPDAMCLKSVVISLIKKWGIMSSEMVGAVSSDAELMPTQQAQFADTMQAEANRGEVININTGEITEADQRPALEHHEQAPPETVGAGGPSF